jgi:hypothetical protein
LDGSLILESRESKTSPGALEFGASPRMKYILDPIQLIITKAHPTQQENLLILTIQGLIMKFIASN